MIHFENFEVSSEKRTLLKPLTLNLTLPCAYGIIGHSGSGKSTFAKSIAMLLDSQLKQKGKIFYNEEELTHLKERRKRELRRHYLKYLVQEPFYALNPYLKIKTQLKEAFDISTSDGTLLEYLKPFGLTDSRILNSYPHELSGGQRQRLALVQALIPKPQVLIADEPTTALDPIIEKQILTLLKNYVRDHGISLFLVSHDLKAIAEMTDTTLVFHDGCLIEVIDSKELLTRSKHPHTQKLVESLKLYPESGAETSLDPCFQETYV